MNEENTKNLTQILSRESGLSIEKADRILRLTGNLLRKVLLREDGITFEYFGRFEVPGRRSENGDPTGNSTDANPSPNLQNGESAADVILPSPRKDAFLEEIKSETDETTLGEIAGFFEVWEEEILQEELVQADQVKGIWKHLHGAFEKCLRDQSSFDLEGVGSFELTFGSGESAVDPKDSTASLLCRIHFHPESSLLDELAEEEIRFVPENRLLSSLASALIENRNVLLFLVPEGDFFFETFRQQFVDLGYDVQFEGDSEEALTRMKTGEKVIVVVDTRLESTTDFTKRVKSDAVTNTCVQIIQIFPEDMDPERPDEFLVVGDQQLQEPFNVDELKKAVEESRKELDTEQEKFEQTVHFKFPTREETLEESHGYTEYLIEHSDLTGEEKLKLRAAFREAIGNAAQHGNHFRRDRMIDCTYFCTRDKISFEVTDEGKGFDHEKYVERGKTEEAINMTRKGHQEGKYGGFGIMLMLRTVDHLEYNEKGNKLTLTDYHSNLPLEEGSMIDGAR